MERSAKILILFGIILTFGVFISGCSESSDQSSSGTVTVTVTTAPLYTAGDVVRSASGSDSPAWLVISYDPADDSYTRALIYKNTDGSYGHRINSKTEISARAVMEKVYPLKITHVTVGSVPTAAPATASPATTTAVLTKVSTKTATTAAATVTPKSTAIPAIRKMDPDEGEAGTTVSTVITGTGFDTNLTALLRHTGESSITARKVTWSSASSVTATFDLPNTTKVGSWDIVITNPNSRSGEYTNYFTVRGNKTALAEG